MSQIQIPDIRIGTDVQMKASLTDSGVQVDWSTLDNIAAYIYSGSQRVIAGKCSGIQVDPEDNTSLLVEYPYTENQYLGVQSLVIVADYLGQHCTFDKPAFAFVATTEETSGTTSVEDDAVAVDITVEDVDSSILSAAIRAALEAADLANEKAEYADEQGDFAKGQGEYAKDQGDYAKAQGDYAKNQIDEAKGEYESLDGRFDAMEETIPNDIIRTASDASFVHHTSARNKHLFYLREATTLLAGLMTASDKVKLSDLPTAEELSAAILAITNLIPAQASTENQLADKAFVNSSISTATATFRGTFNLVNDLHLTISASQADIAAALSSAISGADNNDYSFVQIPTKNTKPNEIARIDRYKYNGTAWSFEYSLNNSSFTEAQWAALNSGITSAAVTKLSALPTMSELETLLGDKVNVSDIIDNLLSNDNTKPLAAKQGKVLDGKISQLGQKLDNNNFVPLQFTPTWNDGYRNGLNFSISSSTLWQYTSPYFIKKGTFISMANVHSSSSVANLCEVSQSGVVIRVIAGLGELVSVSFVAEKDMYVEISRTSRDYDDQIIKLYKFICDDYSKFEENYKTIGLFDRNVFELGNLTISTSNPPIFGASSSRIRTKTPIRLYLGDIIQFPSDTKAYLSWYNYNEGWKKQGWTSGNVAINETADYYLLIRYEPEVEIDNISSIVNSIVIFHANGKQDQLKDGITIRRINGASILGPGNISILRNDFMRRPIRSIAHRGCHILLNPTRNIPEGSKQAFIQAAKQGFDTIEFDIQYTSDGVPVVFHDNTINDVAMNPDGTEISEQVEVTASTYAELMEYDYGIRYGESYAGTKLLTLQEAVSIAKGLGLDIMPEVKRGFNGNRLREVIDIVSSFDMLDNCIWQALATSAGKVNIDIMLDYNDRINVLYLVSGQDISSDNIQIALSAIRDSNKVYIGASYTLLTQVGIGLCKNAGIALVIWTVDSPSYIINDMDSYVCGVISDHTAAQKLMRDNLISQAIE